MKTKVNSPNKDTPKQFLSPTPTPKKPTKAPKSKKMTPKSELKQLYKIKAVQLQEYTPNHFLKLHRPQK